MKVEGNLGRRSEPVFYQPKLPQKKSEPQDKGGTVSFISSYDFERAEGDKDG